MNTPTGKHAIVRDVPDTFNQCIKPDGSIDIDVGLAREQHDAYSRVLQGLGLDITHLQAENQFPDCCFVEDTAIIVGDKAVVLPIGTPSRAGEQIEVGKRLTEYKTIAEIKPPAGIEGGDVLRIGKTLYVGLSGRTNVEAVSELEKLVSGDGFSVIPVPVRNVLHLKSACSFIGSDHVVVYPGHFDEKILTGYKKIVVHEDEAYSANCLAVNGKVLVSRGFPYTRERIETAGFETIELEMSEFKKGGGSLTCLSIIF